MASLVRRLAAALLLGGFAILAVGGATAQDKKKKTLDLHAIMNANKGKGAIFTKINDAAKAEKWDDAQKHAKEFKELGDAIAKIDKPPMGDKDSWAKLTKKYSETTTAIAEAAEKKDAKTVDTNVKAFGKSCKTCHDAHREK